MWETCIQSLGWEDPVEKGKAIYSSILTWRIPWGCKEPDTTERLWLHFHQSLCALLFTKNKIVFPLLTDCSYKAFQIIQDIAKQLENEQSWNLFKYFFSILSVLSPIWLPLEFHLSNSVTPCTVACQVPLFTGILQARILEWVPMPSSMGSSQLRDRTQVSHIAGRFFTIWATREDQ